VSDALSLSSRDPLIRICSVQSTLSSLHDASLDQIVNFVKTEPSTTDPLALYTALSGNVPLKTGLILGTIEIPLCSQRLANHLLLNL